MRRRTIQTALGVTVAVALVGCGVDPDESSQLPPVGDSGSGAPSSDESAARPVDVDTDEDTDEVADVADTKASGPSDSPSEQTNATEPASTPATESAAGTEPAQTDDTVIRIMDFGGPVRLEVPKPIEAIEYIPPGGMQPPAIADLRWKFLSDPDDPQFVDPDDPRVGATLIVQQCPAVTPYLDESVISTVTADNGADWTIFWKGGGTGPEDGFRGNVTAYGHIVNDICLYASSMNRWEYRGTEAATMTDLMANIRIVPTES